MPGVKKKLDSTDKGVGRDHIVNNGYDWGVQGTCSSGQGGSPLLLISERLGTASFARFTHFESLAKLFLSFSHHVADTFLQQAAPLLLRAARFSLQSGPFFVGRSGRNDWQKQERKKSDTCRAEYSNKRSLFSTFPRVNASNAPLFYELATLQIMDPEPNERPATARPSGVGRTLPRYLLR